MDVIVPCKLCHLKQQKGPKVAIYSKKSYFSEKIIPFSYLLLAKSMKFILKLKNHTRVASVSIPQKTTNIQLLPIRNIIKQLTV